jgi:hypothetical protein
MDHQIIEAENVAERYVAGKLSEEEIAGFEEHYLDCPACIARVEDAQRFHRGLRQVAAEEAAQSVIARRLGVLGVLAALVRSRQGALGLTLALALVTLPAALGLWQTGRLRHELAAAQEALQAARRPQGNAVIVSLSPYRASGLETGPVHPIPLPVEPGWIVLSLEPGGAAYPAYRATLLAAGDRAVWQGRALHLDELGTLNLSLHSTFLVPGDYLLRLEGLPTSGVAVPVARFPLRVIRPF